jgi:Spy/CpxP family protein refolding chaperone
VKPRHVIYAVLATLVIFASGVVTGGLLVRNVLPQRPVPTPGPGWQMARLDQFQRAVNQLDLTPEQRMKVVRIARERQEYIADMIRILEPDLPALFVRMRQEIDQVLTPEQRDELDRRWAQVQSKRFGVRPREVMGKPDGSNALRPVRQTPPP